MILLDKAHEILGDIKVATTGYYCPGITVTSSFHISLSARNVKGGGNDEQWSKPCNQYGLTPQITEAEGLSQFVNKQTPSA